MPGTLASLLIKLGLDATGVEQGIARTQQSLLGFSSGAGMAMRSANRAANGGSHWPPPQRHAGDDVLDAHLRRGAALQDFLDLQRERLARRVARVRTPPAQSLPLVAIACLALRRRAYPELQVRQRVLDSVHPREPTLAFRSVVGAGRRGG